MATIPQLLPSPAETSQVWGGSIEVLNAADPRSDGSVPVRLLDQKHPDYVAKIDCWLDLALLHEGGSTLKQSKNLGRILRRRPREDQDVYTARLHGFTYQNILGTALGWYGAAMFGEDPEFFFNGKKSESKVPDLQKSYYDTFLEDCDGNGKNFVDFFKLVFSNILTFGKAWVLTDLDALPVGEVPPATLQEQDDRGLRNPHLMLYNPTNITNYQEDARGALEWVTVKVSTEEQRFLQKPQRVDTWYHYDRETFTVYEDRRSVDAYIPGDSEGRMAKFLRSGRHALANQGKVPVRKLCLDDGLWLANRAYLLLLNHVNQDNSLDWALFMSNLAVPVIIGDIDATNMTSTETGFLQFPAGTTYGWSEPEGKSFDQSSRRLESLREEAFRCMHLQAQGRSMHATPAMQSGRSKIMEMVPAHEVLSAMGGSLRTHMQEILGDVTKARGESGIVPDVRGFNFDDDMTSEEVFAVSALFNLRIPSGKFEKYMYKKVAKAWMRNANHNSVTEVYNEIENGPTSDQRAELELKQRIKLIQSGMAQALQQVNSPGLVKAQGKAAPTTGAPGQGGSVQGTAKTDVSAGLAGQ